MKSVILYVSILLIASALSACGGGSGGGSEAYSISTNVSSIDIKGYLSPDENEFDRQRLSAKISVTYQGDGVIAGLKPGDEDDLAWLDIELDTVTPNTATFTVSVYGWSIEPYQEYQSTIRFVTGSEDGSAIKHVDVPVTYRAGRYFYVDVDSVDLFRIKGQESPVDETLTIFAADSNWVVSSKPDWLSVSASAGTGDGTTHLSCNDIADEVGSVDGQLIIHDQTMGEYFNLDVQCESYDSVVTPARFAVALTKLANRSHLSETIAIRPPNGSENWSAATNEAWLSATPINREGLLIEAIPELLQDGQMHYAQVYLTNQDGDIQQTIQVGLYKNIAVTLPDESTELALESGYVFADPLRPLVYYPDFIDGVGEYDGLVAYNIYTDEIEARYSLTGKCIKPEEISPDGTTIYFIEESFCYFEEVHSATIKVLALDLMSPGAELEETIEIPVSEYGDSDNGYDFEMVINNGVPALIFHPGVIYHAETGEKLADFKRVDVAYDGVVQAIVDGSEFFIMGFLKTDVYQLFIPMNGIAARVSKVASFEYDDVFIYGQVPSHFYIHPDADLIIFPSATLKKVDGEWEIAYENQSGILQYGHGPTGNILATTHDAVGNLVVAVVDKDLNIVEVLTGHAPAGWNYPVLSGDGLVVLTSTWDYDDGRVALIPLTNDE